MRVRTDLGFIHLVKHVPEVCEWHSTLGQYSGGPAMGDDALVDKRESHEQCRDETLIKNISIELRNVVGTLRRGKALSDG